MSKPKLFPSGRCALLVLLLVGCFAHRAEAQVTLGQLPVGWHDDQGRDFSLDQLTGHRVVLTMAYASCHRVCPMTLQALKEMQTELDRRGETADFVVVGLDPARERPTQWRSYRHEHDLTRDNWHFLTGTRAGTAALAGRLNFENWKYDEHVMHDSRAVIFDAAGVQRAALGPDDRNWVSAL